MKGWINESMNQWANESLKQRSSESMTQGTTETMNKWMNERISESTNSWFQWANEFHEPRNQWISESTSQGTNDALNQWTSGSMNQWVNEAVDQWISESAYQRTNQPTNRWNSESMNQWINEPMNQRINESVYQQVKEWMIELQDGWMVDGWVSYFSLWATSSLSGPFAEEPLLSASFPLSSHLSGLLLLWPTSQLPILQLQPISFLCPVVTMRLATSNCNPACHSSDDLLRAAGPMHFVWAGCKPE